MSSIGNWVNFPTLLSALIGAFGANFAAEYVKSFVRKNQKVELERDTRQKEIERVISLLQEYGERYWSSSPADLGKQDQILQSRILSYQTYLGAQITRLFSGESKRDCDIILTRLIKALSAGEFGDINRMSSSTNLTEIHTHALMLRDTVSSNRLKLPKAALS